LNLLGVTRVGESNDSVVSQVSKPPSYDNAVMARFLPEPGSKFIFYYVKKTLAMVGYILILIIKDTH